MSIPEDMLRDATSLNVKEIRAALNRNGYIDEGQNLREVQYNGVNEAGQYMYTILFLQDGEMEEEQIFVEIKRQSEIDNYSFFADF